MLPEEAIRMRSYFIWQREGCPSGRDLDYWLRAKAELEAEEPSRAAAEPAQGKVRQAGGKQSNRKRERKQ